jgi:hypothetical protein
MDEGKAFYRVAFLQVYMHIMKLTAPVAHPNVNAIPPIAIPPIAIPPIDHQKRMLLGRSTD